MKQLLNYGLLIMTMLFWAANFYAVQIALEYYEPFGVATWRFFFGLLTLFILGFIQFRFRIFHFNYSLKEWWYLFLTGFLGVFLTIYFFNTGLKTTSAINGSLIIATSPAVTAIFSRVLFSKKMRPIQWFSIVLSFFGVTIVLAKGELSNLLNMAFEIGDLYIMGMAIVFSLSQIIVSRYLFHIDATTLTTISTTIALLLFITFSVPELSTVQVPSSLDFWVSILFMGIFGTAIAYTSFLYCVVKLGPTVSTLFMNLIPFFAVLLAIPFGDSVSPAQLIGGMIIILGLYLFGKAK